MQQANEPFVPIDDVARHFSVSVSTVRAWVKQNRIPRDTFIKLGNTYRFQISAVTEALTSANVHDLPDEQEPDEPEDSPQMELDLGEPETDDDDDEDELDDDL